MLKKQETSCSPQVLTASIHLHGTWKPSGINTQTVDTATKVIYTLQGVRLNTKFENLPAGVYIVNGKKVLKEVKLFAIND